MPLPCDHGKVKSNTHTVNWISRYRRIELDSDNAQMLLSSELDSDQEEKINIV